MPAHKSVKEKREPDTTRDAPVSGRGHARHTTRACIQQAPLQALGEPAAAHIMSQPASEIPAERRATDTPCTRARRDKRDNTSSRTAREVARTGHVVVAGAAQQKSGITGGIGGRGSLGAFERGTRARGG